MAAAARLECGLRRGARPGIACSSGICCIPQGSKGSARESGSGDANSLLAWVPVSGWIVRQPGNRSAEGPGFFPPRHSPAA